MDYTSGTTIPLLSSDTNLPQSEASEGAAAGSHRVVEVIPVFSFVLDFLVSWTWVKIAVVEVIKLIIALRYCLWFVTA